MNIFFNPSLRTNICSKSDENTQLATTKINTTTTEVTTKMSTTTTEVTTKMSTTTTEVTTKMSTTTTTQIPAVKCCAVDVPQKGIPPATSYFPLVLITHAQHLFLTQDTQNHV